MQQTIHLLSDEAINQIAAGEVIESPASVVKELVENGKNLVLIVRLFFFLAAHLCGFLGADDSKCDVNSFMSSNSFYCEHQCGQWGSESIRSLEWDFVCLLYEAQKFSEYISHNFWKRDELPLVWYDDFFSKEELKEYDIEPCIKKKDFIPEEVEFSFATPMGFSSDWYTQLLTNNTSSKLLLSDRYPDRWDCADSLYAYWSLRHIDDEKGKHIGKIFIREFFREKWKKKQDSDPLALISLDQYQFGNMIDFQNAVLAFEKDIEREVKAERCRNYQLSPQFERAIQGKLQGFNPLLAKIRSRYQDLYHTCATSHGASSAYYHLALLDFQNGSFQDALNHIDVLLKREDIDELDTILVSNLFQTKGEAEVEISKYDEAIRSLSRVIKLNPENKDAYFERAVAFFEKGIFDQALQDYLLAKSSPMRPDESIFGIGFILGANQGVRCAGREFLPTVCSSLQGLGNLVWATLSNPIEVPNQYVNAIYEICEYLGSLEKKELAELLVPELYELVTQWDSLTARERGRLSGFVLGKYGLDILLPIGAIKGVKYAAAIRNLKKAEKLCVLETVAQGGKKRKALLEASSNWNKQRNDWFAKVKIEVDKQSKHIPGAHNYQKGKSILTHSQPESLLEKYAGTGEKVVGSPGVAGYRERINFGEIIGNYVDVATKEEIPTSFGVVHYSKRGAHIVPAKPR